MTDTAHELRRPPYRLSGVVARTRRSLGESLRSRVAGPEADEARARIWDTPGPRWFGPDDAIWHVHADASMFVGGIAALLLQSLHPLAMAGVAGHSGYRGDPWGRLVRTSHYLATTTYGTIEHAEEAISSVRRVHARVRGIAPDGRPYRASDPELLRWVHVAEVWCFLEAHRLFGDNALDAHGADDYVAQASRSGHLLGAEELPESVAELESELAAYRPQLVATDAAREAAHFLLREPPLPQAARFGYALLAQGAVTLLSPWARDALDLSRPRFGRVAGDVGTRTVRWAMGSLS